ncbi:MAG TPA: hypothetical protein VIQ30_23550 [Pseudonocardia sp.]
MKSSHTASNDNNNSSRVRINPRDTGQKTPPEQPSRVRNNPASK